MTNESNYGGREVVSTRILDAPREHVFKAWTEPERLAKWWGPDGFDNPVCELDVRPGGAIRVVMRGPDGSEFPMGGEFREIVPPERLVFLAVPKDRQGRRLIECLTTVTFEKADTRTRLTVRERAAGLAPEAPGMLEGMEAGLAGSLEKLCTLVEGTEGREIGATRLLDAPRDLVWKVWTEPGRIARWWGPNGFTNTVSRMEVKEGGVWKFVMHGPDGRSYDNEFRYLEVEELRRLVVDHVSAPPFRVFVTFSEMGRGTMLTMRMVFETAELRDRTAEKFGAVEGLSQTLGRLAAHLKDLL